MSTEKVKCDGITTRGIRCKLNARKNGKCTYHGLKPPSKTVITMTFCECSENHYGMEMNGNIAEEGFIKDDINEAKLYAIKNNLKFDYYKLHSSLENYSEEEKAYVLVIRGGIDHILGDMNQKQAYNELFNVNWDTKYYDVRRKKVLNKHARKNMCVGDTEQIADFENKKGTIFLFSKFKSLTIIRDKLPLILGEKAKDMLAEGNLYSDININGVGYHGDAERRRVVGCRFGNDEESSSLYYQWYMKTNTIGERIVVPINTGDIYIMSHKAVGTDWKKRNIRTLRHSTGASKYTDRKVKIIKK